MHAQNEQIIIKKNTGLRLVDFSIEALNKKQDY
jgi:hypothetical protein